MTGDVQRRAMREKYGRRGRSGDAEYGVKGLLMRNLEHLRPEQFAKVMDTLGADRRGQQILAAWIGKEKLRDALNLRAAITRSTPCERDIRGRLASFYDWCAQNDDIPELVTLARTISRWEDEITCAVLTGVSNARSEALNRIAKLEARQAYSFRNPANQRRRVCTACTRGNRRAQDAALMGAPCGSRRMRSAAPILDTASAHQDPCLSRKKGEVRSGLILAANGGDLGLQDGHGHLAYSVPA
jgi:hypothetical protein